MDGPSPFVGTKPVDFLSLLCLATEAEKERPGGLSHSHRRVLVTLVAQASCRVSHLHRESFRGF